MQPSEEQQDTIALVRKLMVEPILNLIQRYPHTFIARECPKCRAISEIAGTPFGCVVKHLEDIA